MHMVDVLFQFNLSEHGEGVQRHCTGNWSCRRAEEKDVQRSRLDGKSPGISHLANEQEYGNYQFKNMIYTWRKKRK